MKDISEKIMAEDIKAGVEKTNSYLIFGGLILLFVFLGFWIRTCSKMPPEPNASVECTKAAGQWIPEEYKIINGCIREISAYCSFKK